MKRGLTLKLIIAILSLASVACFAIGCGGAPHEHEFNQQVASSEYLESEATCETKAKYYYSCSCGEKGEIFFEYGDELGHSYGEEISNYDGTHTKTCANDENHTITEKCSGGTATCKKLAQCEVCGEAYGYFLTHTYTNYVYMNDASCEEDGNEIASCDYGCGQEDKRVKLGTALGHVYGNASSNNNGTHTKTCTKNKKHKTIEDCTYVDDKCSECGALSYTEGLVFTLSADEKEYSITDYTGSRSRIMVPSTYKNKPVTSIGDSAFYDYQLLTEIVFGKNSNLKTIGDSAFYKCLYLENLVLPESVTSIGNFAFYRCRSLVNLVIPESVISIGNSAFETCLGLKDLTISNSVKTIGNSAFRSCPLTKVIIPDSVISLGDYVFSNCGELTAVTIGSNVASIGEHAFYYCYSLTNITIPNSVTTIGDSAFRNCTKLASITIPNSVTSMGSFTFCECESLISVIFEANSKLKTISNSMFQSCFSLASVTFGENGQLQTIGNSAFMDCKALTKIEIPNGVTVIEEYAFYSCIALTSFVMPDSVIYIGNNAFALCSQLKAINYTGSISKWKDIPQVDNWISSSKIKIICTDGEIGVS